MFGPVIQRMLEDQRRQSATIDTGSRAAAVLADEVVNRFFVSKAEETLQVLLVCPAAQLEEQRSMLTALFGLHAALVKAVQMGEVAAQRAVESKTAEMAKE